MASSRWGLETSRSEGNWFSSSGAPACWFPPGDPIDHRAADHSPSDLLLVCSASVWSLRWFRSHLTSGIPDSAPRLSSQQKQEVRLRNASVRMSSEPSHFLPPIPLSEEAPGSSLWALRNQELPPSGPGGELLQAHARPCERLQSLRQRSPAGAPGSVPSSLEAAPTPPPAGLEEAQPAQGH